MNEGFYDFFHGIEYDWEWKTAQEFRQREIIRSIKQIGMV
jgi:hypothetical protein